MIKKITVAAPVLVRRINRALAENRQLRVAREGSSAASQVGRYYVVDTRRNVLVEDDIDIESLGRRLGCLRSWEEVGS
jgi:hypothetical protein